MIRNNRLANELRQVVMDMDVSAHAEGSCFIRFGNTQVLCTATIDERNMPAFLRGKGKGWVTAEYGMLPRSTHQRMQRDKVASGGRTQEIQRLIGRSLRAAIDPELLGERQIIIDCDVLQADGGTRTAAITGGFCALYAACQRLIRKGQLSRMPIVTEIAAISCGMIDGSVLLDLDYHEDKDAGVDANFVMTSSGNLIEVQATGEQHPYSPKDFNLMLEVAQQGISELVALQRKALRLT